MSAQKFKKTAKANRRKARIFTFVFHLVLLGGIMYGSTASDQLIEKVEQMWKGEVEKEEPKKKKKNRA